jgi:hypothetical protein
VGREPRDYVPDQAEGEEATGMLQTSTLAADADTGTLTLCNTHNVYKNNCMRTTGLIYDRISCKMTTSEAVKTNTKIDCIFADNIEDRMSPTFVQLIDNFSKYENLKFPM